MKKRTVSVSAFANYDKDLIWLMTSAVILGSTPVNLMVCMEVVFGLKMRRKQVRWSPVMQMTC